jgi:hypothetical protein
VTKNAFDQTPNLTETFDQLKRSSEIRSSDQLPIIPGLLKIGGGGAFKAINEEQPVRKIRWVTLGPKLR